MSVLFRNTQSVVDILDDSVVALAEFVLKEEQSPEREVSLLLVDDPSISELNAKHLGKNQPTDVLAFPMAQLGDAETPLEILGDVVVSAERAVQYAAENGLRVEEELSLYLIHGLLHLLGYDDTQPGKNRKMRRREQELLRKADTIGLLIKTK
jgi:probable rRNA maturation factor